MNSRFIGLQGSASAWLTAKLWQEHRKLLVVCPDRAGAEQFFEDLAFFAGEVGLWNFPAWDTLPFEPVSPQPKFSASRLLTMLRLQQESSWIVVTSIDALVQRVLPAHLIKLLCFKISVGSVISVAQLGAALRRVGYREVSLTEEIGEFSLRGSVVDLFPAGLTHPVRVEFEGENVTRINSFLAESQRSLSELQQVFVPPCRELLPFHAPEELSIDLHAALERLKSRGKELEVPPREIALTMNAVRSGSDLPGIELIQFAAIEGAATLLDYLPSDARAVLHDELKTESAVDRLWESIQDRALRGAAEHRLFPDPESIYVPAKELRERLRDFDPITIDGLEIHAVGESDEQPTQIRTLGNLELSTQLKTRIGTGKAWQPLATFIEAHRSRGERICFVVGSGARRERLRGILLDLGIDAAAPNLQGLEWIAKAERFPVAILPGAISQGAQILGERIVFVAENELFPERSHRRGVRSKKSLKQIISSLAQLREGDFVVHQDFGIGTYHGLTHRTIEGNVSDFLQIEYADSTLYLPVQLIGKVQKFSAADGQRPTIDKLGSNRWVKTKLKVKQSVIALAGDLIRLYAERTVSKGWRFDLPGAEDERFADGFPYDETPDQLQAINEVLDDMAREKPMDRLVCGDVGFGKTEVAVRAAYKCTQHARQAAVLVPTTILVEQHRRTFEGRFRDYPVKLGAVSRFYTPEQNKETLAQLARGEIDIIIGTHRLLSKDVQFSDLGLYIIDEEHRFGVKQKEALKQLKKAVDVLTLTATPIPRTLHMSLLGIRDISLISTAPHDRMVTRTYVAHHEDALIRDAILREIQRGGQCFFVHNRIESIDRITAGLAQLVPEARFRFAHGQMSERELEQIMKQFVEREIDVLVSTTIIESGLDIPNANTIIVDRADTYGLAQLYQLRGRVGRSKRQAYAYFVIPKARKLGLEAQQRLKVLQSLDDLGVGFNLAVRDLEIRGAGNLLGKEQSGSVLSVGYDLYTKILREAVLHLKGEEPEIAELVDPEVKLPVEAYIPEHYIPDISERLVLYQRLSGLSGHAEAIDLRSEIEDRFGPIGRETDNLIELMTIRSVLRQFGIVKAEAAGEKLSISFSPRAPIDGDKILAFVRRDPNSARFTKNHTLVLTIAPHLAGDPLELMQFLDPLLRSIARDESSLSAPPLLHS